MNNLTTWLLIAVLSIALRNTYGDARWDSLPKYCSIERAHNMIGANCAKLQLKSVPTTNITSSAEVLDLSQNEISELTRESFSSLTDLRFLYIFDNMINHIEDDTFVKLLKLEALDFSGNRLLDVSPEIFNLPLLRNLYISDNSFGDRGFDKLQTIPKPIKAPLRVLSIGNNRLSMIPDFGILPELYKLNISSNPMRDLISQQFSPFCHLKEIDLNNTAMEKCRCEEVTRFLLKKREAYLLSSFHCDVISSECKIDYNATYTETTDYHDCMAMRRTVVDHKNWIIVAITIVCFLALIAGLFYYRHRRNYRLVSRSSDE